MSALNFTEEQRLAFSAVGVDLKTDLSKNHPDFYEYHRFIKRLMEAHEVFVLVCFDFAEPIGIGCRVIKGAELFNESTGLSATPTWSAFFLSSPGEFDDVEELMFNGEF